MQEVCTIPIIPVHFEGAACLLHDKWGQLWHRSRFGSWPRWQLVDELCASWAAEVLTSASGSTPPGMLAYDPLSC